MTDPPAIPESETVTELRPLDRRIISSWRVSVAAIALVGVAIFLVVLVGLEQADILTNLALLAAIFVAGLAVAALVTWYAPIVEWRHWRYGIRDDEIELQSGMWTITRTLIPMSRVQHVDFRQGPVERRFGLATIIVHTAAGSREIPGLADSEADPLRSRISALANIHDDV